jgi:hypothetical protein
MKHQSNQSSLKDFSITHRFGDFISTETSPWSLDSLRKSPEIVSNFDNCSDFVIHWNLCPGKYLENSQNKTRWIDHLVSAMMDKLDNFFQFMLRCEHWDKNLQSNMTRAPFQSKSSSYHICQSIFRS